MDFYIQLMLDFQGIRDVFRVRSLSFKLKDDEGREYSYSHEGQMAISVDDKNQKAMLRKVNPGIVVGITVAYDVPQDADLSKMHLEARGGITGAPIQLPLTVQMVQ